MLSLQWKTAEGQFWTIDLVKDQSGTEEEHTLLNKQVEQLMHPTGQPELHALSASGQELDTIARHVTDVPQIPLVWDMEKDPTPVIMHWFGDHAKFILANVPFYG